MRNLIRFITKYSYFFLFLLFETVAFTILLKNNRFQSASFFNSTNAVSGNIYSKQASITDYFSLKETNELLSSENEKLRHFQLNNFQKLYGKNVLINDTLFEQQYFYAKAKIINNSTNKQNNYLTLNIGSKNGVKSGMGVICSNGVVGVIKNVSNHYSTVLSVLHSKSKISCKLKKSDYFGSLQWDGMDYQQGKLLDIPNHVEIFKNDTIVTSSYSATFPAGLPIATILQTEKLEGENFYDINVKYLADYKNISWVYVVKNIWKDEQEEIENLTKEDND